MSYGAYSRTTVATVDPREIEARVFADITSALETHADAPLSPGWIEAVFRNQQLWNSVVADLSGEGNPYPNELKASLISIGLWVQRHSEAARRSEATVAALIDVNKSILRGLMTRPAAPAAPSQPSPVTEPVQHGLEVKA